MVLKCECGGTLREAIIEEFDFSAFAGLPVFLKNVPGYRCSKCGGETLEGTIIHHVLHRLTFELMKLPHRLSPGEVRFLRKRLRLSQSALAAKFGIVRETVAKWECGSSEISPQHDFMLRVLAASHLLSVIQEHSKSSVTKPEIISALPNEVRTKEPIATPTSLVIDDFLKRSRSNEKRQRH